MYNRYLEKKMEVVPEEEMVGTKIPIELEYYIIESNENAISMISDVDNKAYGIEIVKKVDDSMYESEMLKDISTCMEDTRRILNRLATNTVTPIEMAFVIDDMLAE